MLYYFIILLDISVQISSEKYNTKKKKEEGGAFWRGALNGENTVKRMSHVMIDVPIKIIPTHSCKILLHNVPRYF